MNGAADRIGKLSGGDDRTDRGPVCSGASTASAEPEIVGRCADPSRPGRALRRHVGVTEVLSELPADLRRLVAITAQDPVQVHRRIAW